jgi:dTDP-4-amino-4,6-dideoxygalactose transaminase
VTTSRVPFIDLRPGADLEELQRTVARVVGSGWYVLGPELEQFEAEFARASGAPFAVGVGNGTDAITLLLRAAGVGPGDEVLVPALTAAFTGLAVIAAGARPVFVDVDASRLTMDPDACAAAVTPRTRAIVPVHLYGQPADTGALLAIARRHSLVFVEDCCQAHLATSDGQPVGTAGAGGAFSFYPTKNLGALGDGGAVITRDPAVADRVRRLRNGGQSDRAHHAEAGINSRLDEVQAAVLRVRLRHLPAWTARRRELAAVYRRHLPAPLLLPEFDRGHVYHLFAVRTPGRDALQAHLRRAGIDTLVHYPVALPDQPAFSPYAPAACPRAAAAAAAVLSLPLHPGLADEDAVRVADAAGAFSQGRMPA